MLKPSRLTATFLPASLLIFPPIAGLAASSFGGAATAVAFFKVFFTSFALSLLSPAFLEQKPLTMTVEDWAVFKYFLRALS